MSKPRRAKRPPRPMRLYSGANIPRAVIRRYARDVARLFDPEKIILFGSYAYGEPHADSDVDLLVVMSTRGEISQAVRIQLAVEAPFPMDLIVRTPQNLAKRLAASDSFFTEVITRGTVLYEKTNGGLGAKSRSRLRRRDKANPEHSAAP